MYKAAHLLAIATRGLSKRATDDIEDLATKYYEPVGAHGMPHIRNALAHANQLVSIRKSNPTLTDAERAAVLFHDSGIRDYGRAKHELSSARVARRELKNRFDPATLKQIARAVAEHRASYKGKYYSDMSDLVSSADLNPPDLANTIKRSYQYGVDKGWPEERRLQNAVYTPREKYGTKGYARFPAHYTAYHKPELKKFREAIDKITIGDVRNIVHGQ